MRSANQPKPEIVRINEPLHHLPTNYDYPDYCCNPLDYNWERYVRYLLHFGIGENRILWVGMNPSKGGMTLTGIPFGDPAMLSKWMGIDGIIFPNPSLPGTVRKYDASGWLFWQWVARRWDSPEDFFRDCFVVNYCPLFFSNINGHQITLEKLTKGVHAQADIDRIMPVCDAVMKRLLCLLHPRLILCFGNFVHAHMCEILESSNLHFKIDLIPHPSLTSRKSQTEWKSEMNSIAYKHDLPSPQYAEILRSEVRL